MTPPPLTNPLTNKHNRTIMRSMKYIGQMLFLMLGMVVTTQAVPPVLNYAGQVTVDGEAFDGNGLFKFALVNADGTTTYWSNDGTSKRGSEPKASVSVPVNGGLYAVLLGNTALKGMGAIDPAVFAQYTNAKLRVWFSDGVNGFQKLSPDRPFASVPYAFSAGTAQTAGSAPIPNGAVNFDMLSHDVKTKINTSFVGSLLALPYGSDAPAGYSLYQQSEKTWNWKEASPHLGGGQYIHNGVVFFNNEIYIAGGWNNNGPIDKLQKFNPSSNNWQYLANLNFPRERVASTILNGKIYVIGGKNYSTIYKSVEIYDPESDIWTIGTPLPFGIHHSTAQTKDGKIYLLGGLNSSNQSLSSVLSFDPNINEWNFETNMTIPIAQGVSCIFDNRIWIAKNHDVLSYDSSAKTWKTETSFTNKRDIPIIWTYKNKIFAAGGSQRDDIVVLSHNKEAWNKIGSLPNKYNGGKADVIGDKLFLVAGRAGNPSISFNTDEVFFVNLDAPTEGLYDLYRKDGDAPVGTPVFQSEYADGSVTGSKLDATILKYLKPEITSTPEIPDLILGGQTVTLQSQAKGKYLTYQWYKNGQAITGATSENYVIDNANKSLHDGNYSLVISNDFGAVSTPIRTVTVSGIHTVDLNASVAIDMIWCPPGTFMMGEEGVATPVHQVTLTHGFYLGKYEVTQAQYEAVMTGNSEGLNAKPSNWSNNNRPVDQVSWNDIQVFLSRLNDMEEIAGRLPRGWKYVLPTEAQWEYACRAGTTTAYWWGDSITSSNANYVDTETINVGNYAANPWGFYDMHGNAGEWVNDWFSGYPGGSRTNPKGPASGRSRVIRCWATNIFIMEPTSALRMSYDPGSRIENVGFRVSLQKSQ